MRLGRIQKKIVAHLREHGGKAPIVFGQRCCPNFSYHDREGFEPSLERLLKRGVTIRLNPHFMYQINDLSK